MNARHILVTILLCGSVLGTAFLEPERYEDFYGHSIDELDGSLSTLLQKIHGSDLSRQASRDGIRAGIASSRLKMKAADFWMRYFDPVQYLRVNGQLPVEWETEVFEKFEKPYRRDGAGLSLAYQYLETDSPAKDSLLRLVQGGLDAVRSYRADSNLSQLSNHDHFFLGNRLFLLNLATIYTTGFECPNDAAVIPELKHMMRSMEEVYLRFTASNPSMPVLPEYMTLFGAAARFVAGKPDALSAFDHFTFIRDFVNPLFALNRRMMTMYGIRSARFVDFTLVDSTNSIFSKALYQGQHTKGIFSLVDDPATLSRIHALGRRLFYDPILSGNGKRSCASCHVQSMYFTDTTVSTARQFDSTMRLSRSAPSLLNVPFHHLIMQDGKHLTLQEQGKAVTRNPIEMNGGEGVVERVMSCPDYRSVLQDLARLTPEEDGVTLDHIASSISYYYGGFSNYASPFDDAMNRTGEVGMEVKRGFNLFMGKARCGTCHFAPQFSGVKPPYVSSEFEVLGVPADTFYKSLSPDSGRFLVHPVAEMMNAFRTPTLRNIERTPPYMHNGRFPTLGSVLAFYDAGGGVGHGLHVRNQTLEADSLHLSSGEIGDLTAFLRALTEKIPFEAPPTDLPRSRHAALNGRKVGGEY